jgi:hypothetical protein
MEMEYYAIIWRVGGIDTTGRRRKEPNQCFMPLQSKSWSAKLSMEKICCASLKKRQRLRGLVRESWYLIVATVEERRISSASRLLENVRHHKLVGNTPASWMANYGAPQLLFIEAAVYNACLWIARKVLVGKLQLPDSANTLSRSCRSIPVHVKPAQNWFQNHYRGYRKSMPCHCLSYRKRAVEAIDSGMSPVTMASISDCSNLMQS